MTDQKTTLGMIAIILFASILFFPQGSTSWKGIFFLGLILGIWWFFKK